MNYASFTRILNVKLNIKIAVIAANALLKSGSDFAFFPFSAQDEPFAAATATDDDFCSLTAHDDASVLATHQAGAPP